MQLNSGTWVVVVIPSIIALIFSVLVTIGIIADVSDRAKQLQLKRTQGSVAILMRSTPPSPSSNPKHLLLL
ncbi:MAG: hypothetical protein ACJ72R_13490 [Nitrososphaeraceae archaeon]